MDNLSVFSPLFGAGEIDAHSITFMLLVALYLGAPIYVIARTSKPKERESYVQRALLGIILLVVLKVARATFTPVTGIYLSMLDGMFISMMVFMLQLVLIGWAAARCIDIGVSKWWLLLSYIPLLLIVIAIGLMFPASKSREASGHKRP